MLDTPYMWPSHLSVLPNPTVVEQIVSSVFGALEFPETQKISPGTYYRYKMLDGMAARDTVGWRWDLDGHELAHRWYARTISPANEADAGTLDGYGTDGFALSPFLNGPMAPRAAGKFAFAMKAIGGAPAADLASQSLAGFFTFGNVTQAGSSYTITEQANAGIYKSLTMPIGAQKLTFRYRFASAGDGDFLSVRFGDDADLYIGLDTELSRQGLTTVEVPLDGVDGQTADLVFTLISRGAANAVVEIADIGW